MSVHRERCLRTVDCMWERCLRSVYGWTWEKDFWGGLLCMREKYLRTVYGCTWEKIFEIIIITVLVVYERKVHVFKTLVWRKKKDTVVNGCKRDIKMHTNIYMREQNKRST